MKSELKYIELKTGYSDDGPAWVGMVKASKTGKTIYFNGHAFQKYNGVCSNYIDIETGEEYWISGIKKNGCDRHWSGSGKVVIDKRFVSDYLQFTGQDKLDLNNYIPAEIKDDFPVQRINRLLNEKSNNI